VTKYAFLETRRAIRGSTPPAPRMLWRNVASPPLTDECVKCESMDEGKTTATTATLRSKDREILSPIVNTVLQVEKQETKQRVILVYTNRS
jgi:hypothetical protein